MLTLAVSRKPDISSTNTKIPKITIPNYGEKVGLDLQGLSKYHLMKMKRSKVARVYEEFSTPLKEHCITFHVLTLRSPKLPQVLTAFKTCF